MNGSTTRERQYLYNEQLVSVSVQFPLIKNTKSTNEVREGVLGAYHNEGNTAMEHRDSYK